MVAWTKVVEKKTSRFLPWNAERRRELDRLIRCVFADGSRFTDEQLCAVFDCKPRTLRRQRALIRNNQLEDVPRKKDPAKAAEIARDIAAIRRIAGKKDKDGDPIHVTWSDIGRVAISDFGFRREKTTLRRRAKEGKVENRVRASTVTTSKADARAALAYARKYLPLWKTEQQLKKLAVLDETTVNEQGNLLRIQKCVDGEKPRRQKRRKGCKKFTANVCVIVTWTKLILHIFPEGKRNSCKVFREEILKTYLPTFRKKTILMDGCGIHWGKGRARTLAEKAEALLESNSEWLEEKNIGYIRPSPYSPPLNPAENPLSELHSYIGQRTKSIKSRADLLKVCKEWADSFPAHRCRDLLRSYPRRLEKCIEQKGEMEGRAVDGKRRRNRLRPYRPKL